MSARISAQSQQELQEIKQVTEQLYRCISFKKGQQPDAGVVVVFFEIGRPLFWGNVTNAIHEENFGKPTAACGDYLSPCKNRSF